jgi:hypothetical protein
MIRKALTYLGIAVSLLPSLVGAKELSNERPVNFLDNGDVIEQEFVDRIDSFSSVLGDEVRAGLLGTDFVLSFLSGAIYRHGDVPEIGIPCEWRAFGERVCDWEALPHELGHHVYAGLSEDDKQRVGVVLEERLALPDAGLYQSQMVVSDSYLGLLKHLTQSFMIPLDKCIDFQSDISTLEDAQDILREIGGHDDLIDEVEELKQEYVPSFPTCTKENRDYMFRQLDSHELVSLGLVDLHNYMYLNSLPGSAIPEYEFSFPVKDQELMSVDVFSPINQRLARVFEGARDDSSLDDVLRRRAGANVIIVKGLAKPRTRMVLSEAILVYDHHDASPSELFAAAVHSLYVGYDEGLQVSPMYFTLTPELVTVMEGLDYKGEKIFEGMADKYRVEVFGE